MASIEATRTGAARNHDAPAINPFYFAAWRWHFYAGVFVIPFLLVLATTGSLIIWFTAIAPEYGDRLTASGGGDLSISRQAAIAEAVLPGGKVSQYIAPYDDRSAALFRVEGGDLARMVALDPHSGKILRDRQASGTWNEWLTDLHGTLLMGDFGDRVLEVAAGLALMLIATGLYLWWPRGKGWRAALVPVWNVKGRAWWKSLHMVTGFWISALLVAFLVTGMAWTGVWGGKLVQAWASFPAEKWDAVPLSDATHAAMNHGALKEVPWGLEQTPMPNSGSLAGITGIAVGEPVNIDTVVNLGRALGFDSRFQLDVPADETGVWTLSRDSMSYDSTNPFADRTVHVDQYTGHILADVGFADYSGMAKFMAAGTALHEGMTGTWNVVLNLGFCFLVAFVCLSGIVMWWKRRPAGVFRIVAPPLPANMPLWKGAMLIGLALCMAFPLTGLAVLAVLALDVMVLSWAGPLRRLVS